MYASSVDVHTSSAAKMEAALHLYIAKSSGCTVSPFIDLTVLIDETTHYTAEMPSSSILCCVPCQFMTLGGAVYMIFFDISRLEHAVPCGGDLDAHQSFPAFTAAILERHWVEVNTIVSPHPRSSQPLQEHNV